eukprot:COSAG04_NODE_1269_length_7482_cov_15.529077_5_plen_85_part_00
MPPRPPPATRHAPRRAALSPRACGQLAANCLGGLLGTISAIGALYWPLVVLMGLWLVSSAYNLARVLMAKRDIRMAAAVAKQGA